MFARVLPAIVSLLGAAGLATSLAYFAGVYLAFQPDWQEWAQFFVPRALLLLLIPVALLVSHLYLRTRLGVELLGRGSVDEAIAYCEDRLTHNLSRSRKEALVHRITLARAHMHRGDYDTALGLLTDGYSVPRAGRPALEVHRWQMEASLRREDLVRCREAWQAVSGCTRPKQARAYVLACRAELAVREANQRDFDEAIAEALWATATCPRVRLSQVLGALRFGAEPTHLDEALAILDEIWESSVAEVPGREAELWAVKAEICQALGRHDQARAALDRAGDARADGRADCEIRRVEQLIDDRSAQASAPHG